MVPFLGALGHFPAGAAIYLIWNQICKNRENCERMHLPYTLHFGCEIHSVNGIRGISDTTWDASYVIWSTSDVSLYISDVTWVI